MATYRMKLGDFAEKIAAEKLASLGWLVSNLNAIKTNFPNVDLKLKRDAAEVYVQVKACTQYRMISAGGVNPAICAGASLFNKVAGSPNADFILCMSPAEKSWEGDFPDQWRYFVLPVDVAEAAFRINVDAYFNGIKHSGGPRSQKGSCQDFVGPGELRSRSIPDHRDDYLPYEGRFDLLEGAPLIP